MIIEQWPEVQKLPASQKRQLAEELLRDVDATEEVEVDASILELLERRLAEHSKHPTDVSSWADVSRRVFKRHES
jgi:putative addiction module component (TIGR02574 family)